MKHYLWIEEFNHHMDLLMKEGEDQEVIIPKLVYYGVKYINNSNNEVATLEEAAERVKFIKLILALVQQLAPQDLYDIFPLERRYKILDKPVNDYVFSLGYIQGHGPEMPIKNPLDLLWYYGNEDTGNFIMNFELTIRHLLGLKGEYDFMDEESDQRLNEYKINLIKETSIGPAKIYRTPEGRAYLINEEGKSIELKRQFPGYLKSTQ